MKSLPNLETEEKRVSDDLVIIEKYLGDMFMPDFGKAIVNKQLADIGATRENYDRDILNTLLKNIEEKVLLSFKGDDARKAILEIKKKIMESG